MNKSEYILDKVKEYLKYDLRTYDRHEYREWGQFNRFQQSFYLYKYIRDLERKLNNEDNKSIKN